MDAETPRARVVARLFDGTTVQAEGAWMAASDRFEFERLFGVSLIGLLGPHVDATGKVPEDRAPELLRGLQERYLAFFAWRLLAREGKHFGTFDQFCEQVLSLDIEPLRGNPSAPAPPRG